MSMISEQVKRLRDYASDKRGEIADICNEAARTIEELSEKLHAANMERSSAHYNGGWIPTEECLPGNGEWVIASDRELGVQEMQYGNGVFCRDGVAHGTGIVLAWQKLPEPYQAEEKDVTKP